MTGARLRLSLRVALCDLRHRWPSSACLIAGAAIALAPVLLLFALNYGFVEGLIEKLRSDPRTREIRPVGQHMLDETWFEAMRADPRVAFVLPRTRYLASPAFLRAPGRPGAAEIEMSPTAPGDPILPGDAAVATADAVALSASVALTLGVAVGDEIELFVTREVAARRDRASVRLTISGVVPRDLYQRDGAFVAPALMDAIERWKEGAAVPEFGWPGEAREEARASWASFRMFARDVRDVPALRDDLLRSSIDAQTEAAAISRALAIEEGLGAVFLFILALSTGGVLLTLGFQLASSVAERSFDFSALRMLGMVRSEIVAVPVIQGGLVACLGAVAAAGIVLAAQPIINERLAGIGEIEGPIARLLPAHALVCIVAMTAAGGLSGTIAGRRASRLEPAEGLRRG